MARRDVAGVDALPVVTTIDNVADMSDREYTGPPSTLPPPRGWRVNEVIGVAPPRKLPTQDREAIHAQRLRARTITQGMGILFASLMFVVLLVVLIRAL
ncbi:hypothetical protein FB566_1219 [Stackebrandtia endophytica]|uniref:Uncharacterized protein n=2 Tax=Stackebrandtia endophytica TaxID=1496996 RepID=A0A543AT02_9ACTN|nr:hypothetical protein FB566_1219 [Stackebrandtia endophytica]